METTILLVDDHPIVRQGLRLLLEGKEDMRIVGEAGDGQTAIERVRELNPDVVIMDITMPQLSGVDATRQILAESPDTKVIALSIHGEKHFIEEMLAAGAAGYILKDSIPEELVSAVQAVMRGEVVLSGAVAGVVVSEYRKALSGELISAEQEEATAVARLIPTKLHSPPIPPDLVPRPHLLARLGKALQRPLTLISASAGYGKTTLLAVWLETMAQARPDADDGGAVTPSLRSAWLNLDEEDSDLVIFASYFLAAVQTLFPDAGGDTQSLLQAASRYPLSALAGSLLSELGQIEEPFVVVLDDYHRIEDQEVHELLASLIERLPPQMHLAIASRTDPPFPLTRLRAGGKVVEIRTGDLRFSLEETHTFLDRAAGQELDRATTDLLGRKTEGWIAGLRLAALSIQGLPDVDAFVQRFKVTGSDYVADYLLDEVLSRQGQEVQEFLMRSSILGRFCASLCDAILDDGRQMMDDAALDDRPQTTDQRRSSFLRRPSSPGEAMLDELRGANLFLVPLDAEGVWYRYHHLVQDLLRERLGTRCSPEELATLHTRASAWFAENDLVDEALDHALAAGDVAGAGRIVEQNRNVVLVDDQWYNLARWMDRLPDEIKGAGSEILLARAWVLWHRLDLETFPSVLGDLEDAFAREAASEPAQGEMDFFRGYLSYFQGLGPQAEEYYAGATERIPETYHTARWEAELHHALARHMNGRKEVAVERLTGLLRSNRVSRGISQSRLWAGLCFIHLLEGELAESMHPAQRVRELAAADKNRFVEGWASYLEASVLYRRNELDRAVDHLDRSAGKVYVMDSTVAVDCLCALSLAYQHMKRPDEADEIVRLLLEFIRQVSEAPYRAIASSLQARLSLLRGDTAAAVRWLRTADLAEDTGLMLWWLEVPQLTACRVLIAEGSAASLQQATDRLEQYDRENAAVHNTCQRIDILSLLALAIHKQGRTDEALATLGRAVDLGEPGGFIRPFVDLGVEMAGLLQELVAQRVADGSLKPATGEYLTRVFAAFPQPVSVPTDLARGPGTAPGLVEPLTGREMEVLALLAKRLTNPEIARDLFITVGTVKQHTNNIYGKLGVNDRRQAVARARSLGLLPP